MAMASWVPWTLLLTLLPSSATELLQDEVERQRLRDELTRLARDYSKLLLLWALRAAQVFAGLSCLVVTASLLYAMLYYLVIPSRFHEQDIFLDYGGRHAALVPGGGALPTASLNLLEPERQWESLVPQPKQQQTQPVLVPGVKYDVIVELTVPESRTNAEVGVFMVSTTLHEGNKHPLARSARPVTLHDMPAPVRWLRLGFWLVPYALGFTEPAQTLRVTTINGYLETAEHPLTRVDVMLNTPVLQVYSAKLTVIAQLTGVRFLMYHWAVPTAILVILNIVLFEVLALVILYAVYALPQIDAEADADAAVLMAAAADTAALEAQASAAREKAKQLFKTEESASSDADVKSEPLEATNAKSESLIDEVSFTSTSAEEASAVLGEASEDSKTEAAGVKVEPVLGSP